MPTQMLATPPRQPHPLRPFHLVPLVLALAVSQAYGATGKPGTPGIDGVGAGAAGTSGGNGEDAIEILNGYSVIARAGSGGRGGDGANGLNVTNGGAAGSGGNGGNASATANRPGPGSTDAYVEATGGDGGDSGEPGPSWIPSFHTGAAGKRGRGGDATAILNSGGSQSGTIVSARGGNGGNGEGYNTDAVGGAAHAAMVQTIPADEVSGTVTANGGSGGSAVGYPGTGLGSAGGAASLKLDVRGADVTLTTALRGGDGGNGIGRHNKGANGASATVSAAVSASNKLQWSLSASGGHGGAGGSSANGGHGAAVTLRDALQVGVPSGPLDLEVSGWAGNGGNSYDGAAGSGGAADVRQTLDARQASSARLRVVAYAGNAGNSSGYITDPGRASVQAGSDARAELQLLGTGPVTLSTYANAGNGGGYTDIYASDNSAVGGRRGGDGTAVSVATTGTALASTSTVEARGGGGGKAGGPNTRGGDGGNGYARGSLHNSGSGAVALTVTAQGGQGGRADGIGGNGGNTTLDNAISGSTSGKLELKQVAIGGNGGYGVKGGNGGNAVSRLVLTDGRSADIAATVVATGGGVGGQDGLGGTAEAVLDLKSTVAGANVSGTTRATGGQYSTWATPLDHGTSRAHSQVRALGNAVSQATSDSSGYQLWRRGSVDSYARAVGGTGANATALAVTGRNDENIARGRAEAESASGAVRAVSTALGHEVDSVATARSAGAADNVAIADGEGVRGSVLAQSTSTRGAVLVGTSASATVQGDTQARTQSNVGGLAYELIRPSMAASGARSYASALPDSASIAPLLAAAPEAAMALAGNDILGVGTMQGSRALALTYDTTSYVTAANFQFDGTGGRYLTLGLLGSLAQGTGLRELEFTVSNHGTELFSQTFASIADAQLFFSDNALNLGMLGAGSQDVLVSAGFTYTGAGGFSFQYALGVSAVPEPQTWMLMLLGLTVVLVRRKARG